MSFGISRKLSLQNYGGFPYETADFWVECEDEISASKLAALNVDLNIMIENYIANLPDKAAAYKAAMPVHPTVSTLPSTATGPAVPPAVTKVSPRQTDPSFRTPKPLRYDSITPMPPF